MKRSHDAIASENVPEEVKAVAEELGAKVKDALEEKKVAERRHPRPNQQLFDTVVIKTAPRYKTSNLSGNEWRIGADVTVSYKGHTVWDAFGSTVPEALQDLARAVHGNEFGEALRNLDVSAQCDQEGCDQPWTHSYSMKKLACKDCGERQDAIQEWEPRPPLRKFCERHAQRGNCGIEDAQSNYEVVETLDKQKAGTTPEASGRVSDESKAGLVVVGLGSDDGMSSDGFGSWSD